MSEIPSKALIASETQFLEITIQDLRAEFEKENTISLVGSIAPPRLGTHLLSTLIEFTYFSPQILNFNDDFKLVSLEWYDMKFAIINFPINTGRVTREDIDKLCVRCGVRISDGIPHIITKDGIESFPINSPNTFSIENVPGHPIYNPEYLSYMESLIDLECDLADKIRENLIPYDDVDIVKEYKHFGFEFKEEN